ncbi:MAG: hypothetical protein KAS74_01325, partial [Methanosarcinales archaeon]|nr:hypothetical protein [Methanosarcinales archaeon]
ILNPEWVTNGVYAILNSNELFHAKGVLKREMLNRILDSHDYPSSKHIFIVDMMRKFELCFDFEGFSDQKFLIPDLLSKEEPHTGEWDDALAFQYHYDALPGSIISRFIVGMHHSIYKNTYWRSGVVLEDRDSGNKALVKADREDKKIFIRVSGREQTRRAFLRAIRSKFEYIHKTIPGIEPEEKVPLPGHPEIVVGYRHLLDMEEMDVNIHFPEGLKDKEGVPVKELLDGVESEEERRERKVVSGAGITAGRDVIIGDVGGQIAIGKDIAQQENGMKGVGPAHRPTPPPSPETEHANPWITVSVYLMTIVVIMTAIAVISNYVSWHVLSIVIIGGILFFHQISVLQLMREGKLGQDTFRESMRDIFKQLHLLKK